MARSRRAIYYCQCAWNECTLRSWKEPRKCVCEQNNPAVNWIIRSAPVGQQKLELMNKGMDREEQQRAMIMEDLYLRNRGII